MGKKNLFYLNILKSDMASLLANITEGLIPVSSLTLLAELSPDACGPGVTGLGALSPRPIPRPRFGLTEDESPFGPPARDLNYKNDIYVYA